MNLGSQDELYEAMARAFGGDDQPEEPITKKLDLEWKPKLNPVQEYVYRSTAMYVLAYGERGTGKSIGGLHKMVRHCVRNKNALAFVIVREVGQATEGGAWSKLQTEILPTWKNGNYCRKTRKYLDKGCGIEFTAPKLDPSDKKPYIWVSNRFGGWSMIKLISLFVGEHVEDKVKGKEPSFIFVDEAQTLESDEYFTKVSQQVGRRPDIDDPQQIIYACNPKGPSHWLYKTFFVHKIDAEDEDGEVFPIDEETGHPINPATNKAIKEYAIFHVPITENIANLPAGYWDRVLTAVKNDPIEKARMVDGEWVDKPEGASLFRDIYNDRVHVKGDMIKGVGIHPVKGVDVIIGWDPGGAHTCITLEQLIVTVKKSVWLWFDELNYVGRYRPYGKRNPRSNELEGVVPDLIERLLYWEKATGETFRYRHISDDSAFNQFRAKDGSFDAADIEEISRQYVKEKKLPERFIIKMRACPKGPNSVPARVRVVTDALIEESLVISAVCQKSREMFMQLEEDKDDRLKPKRSKHLHPFDSGSYPMLYFQAGRGKWQMKASSRSVEPMVFKVGG